MHIAASLMTVMAKPSCTTVRLFGASHCHVLKVRKNAGCDSNIPQVSGRAALSAPPPDSVLTDCKPQKDTR